MIGWFLSELATRALGGLLSSSRRGRAPLPTSRGRARPREVTVSADEMAVRAHEYETWARSHGLELASEDGPSAHGARFRGTRCGRAIELTTGLSEYGAPRSPELLVWTAALAPAEPVLLSLDEPPPAPAPPWSRELAMVLEGDGVRDIGVTQRFVRVRFDAFVAPKAVEKGWNALELALATLATPPSEAERESPYR